MPECMKVESPSTATVLPSLSFSRALLKPWIELTEAPIHSQVSMAYSGS